MKRKTKHRLLLAAILLLCLLLAGLAAWAVSEYRSAPRTSQEIYASNWGLSIPSGCEELYQKKDPVSFHGDGRQYTVYSVPDLQSDFFSGFSSEQNSELEAAVQSLLTGLEVPEDKWPDVSQCQWKALQKYYNRLYLLLDEERAELYLVERLA